MKLRFSFQFQYATVTLTRSQKEDNPKGFYVMTHPNGISKSHLRKQDGDSFQSTPDGAQQSRRTHHHPFQQQYYFFVKPVNRATDIILPRMQYLCMSNVVLLSRKQNTSSTKPAKIHFHLIIILQKANNSNSSSHFFYLCTTNIFPIIIQRNMCSSSHLHMLYPDTSG